MMDGGEYADGHASKFQRIASVGTVAFWAIAIYLKLGLPLTVRYLAFSFLALACIWFPSAMANFNFRWSRHFTAEPANPKVHLFAAWLFIAVVPLVFVIVRWSLGLIPISSFHLISV